MYDILKAFMRDALRGHPDATPALLGVISLIAVVILWFTNQ